MTKLIKLEEIEELMDTLNGEYGDLCLYCKSKEYNSQVGIVHSNECAIQQIRDLIKINS